MKVVVQVRLLPTPRQAAALEATMTAVNLAANRVSGVAFHTGTFRNYDLRKTTYMDLKTEYGPAAQAAQHVIKKVADAYRALHANLQAGNLGKIGDPRRVKAESTPIVFRSDAAQPYDDRCLSWLHDARTVSIWTVAGRVKDVAFTGSAEQLAVLAKHRQGESDLVARDGKWFLIATCEVPAAAVNADPGGWVGVDLGIVNIATTSDGARHAGRRLNRYRRRQLALRTKLQAKGTKAATRLLRARRRKEARFARDVNHTIAKKIVTVAERTGRGIALEDLTGIRDRVRLRTPQRVTLHSWSFAALGAFIGYKARRAGVPVVFVDPSFTSQTCAECGHRDKKNRVSQAQFVCRSCGVVAHADRNAARNIAARAPMVWAAVGPQSTGSEGGTPSTTRARRGSHPRSRTVSLGL